MYQRKENHFLCISVFFELIWGFKLDYMGTIKPYIDCSCVRAYWLGSGYIRQQKIIENILFKLVLCVPI